MGAVPAANVQAPAVVQIVLMLVGFLAILRLLPRHLPLGSGMSGRHSLPGLCGLRGTDHPESYPPGHEATNERDALLFGHDPEREHAVG